MKTEMRARKFGGDFYDDDYLRAANLDESCIGKYAVLQVGGIALGVGDTYEDAIEDAEKYCGEKVEITTNRRANDSDCECVLVESVTI